MSLQQKDPVNLIIAGVGGQGNVTISRLIDQAMVDAGYAVMVGETYGASQRGGAVASHIRISRDTFYGPLIPAGQVDVILGMEPVETLRILTLFGGPGTSVITNIRPVYPPSVATGEMDYPGLNDIKNSVDKLAQRAWYLDATEISLKLGNSLLTNMVMVGALINIGLIPLTADMFKSQMEASFSGKRLSLNIQGFEMGLTYDFIKNEAVIK